MSKTYVFAIGGTGARVLRSLTHLLASGVQCNTTLVPVIIDPDVNNGDLTRTVGLLQRYTDIRKQLAFNTNTKNKFFDTEVFEYNNFRMPINNSSNHTFKQFMNFDSMNEANQAMLKMLYSDSNLSSDMVVGFKGNPNIGSVVLNQFTETAEFVNLSNDITQGDKFFIISSIFGGTGASGFPLLLKTLRTNNNLPNHGLINNAPIGAVTVLPYFKVESNNESSIESDTFISKTKAALSYYDKNICNEVDTLYYIGDNSTATHSYENNEGGNTQKNSAHIIEMLSALAVIDFANSNTIRGNTVFKEFGLQNIPQGSIIFNDFAQKTNELIKRSMTQYILFAHYMRHSYNYIQEQQWSKVHALDRNFFSSDFMSNINKLHDDYLQWLEEMESNKISFAPYTKNTEKPFEIVVGKTPSKWITRTTMTKKDYQLFDVALDETQVSNNSESKEQIFMELFYQATKLLCEKKLNM